MRARMGVTCQYIRFDISMYCGGIAHDIHSSKFLIFAAMSREGTAEVSHTALKLYSLNVRNVQCQIVCYGGFSPP